MLKTGCCPDVVTFSTLLRGLCKICAERLPGECGHLEYTILIKGIVQSGRVNHALVLLREMDNSGARDCQPDVVTYNTIVHGLCKHGRVEEALQLFEVMKSEDVFTFRAVLWGFREVKTTGIIAQRNGAFWK